MRRRWVIAIGVTAVWSGVVTVMMRQGSRAESGGTSESRSEAQSSATQTAPELVERRFEVRRAAESKAGRPRPAPSERAKDKQRLGVGAGIERIATSTQFRAFAESAGLDEDQRYALARILALHYENERNLGTTDPEQELALSMQRQLLNDTRAQLRARLQMSDETWDTFERSGLLSAPPADQRGAAAAPGGDPT